VDEEKNEGILILASVAEDLIATKPPLPMPEVMMWLWV